MDVERLSKEFGCEELLKAYIMRECECSKEQAQEGLWDAMEYLDEYLHNECYE